MGKRIIIFLALFLILTGYSLVTALNATPELLLERQEHSSFRRVRSPLVAEIERIFREIAEEKGLTPEISPTFRKEIELYARLLSFNLPGIDLNFIKGLLTKNIDEELKMFRDSKEIPEEYQGIISDAYTKLRQFMELINGLGIAVKIPQWEEFKEDVRLKTVIYADRELAITSSYLSIVDKILIDIYVFTETSLPTRTVVHEGLHKLLPGFRNPVLNEGMTELITKDIIGDENPLRSMYALPIEIMQEMQEVVGKETLLRAYAIGSYQPLREKLGDRLVDIFQKIDIASFSEKYSLMVSVFISVISRLYPEEAIRVECRKRPYNGYGMVGI